jgi:hypothetical protein
MLRPERGAEKRHPTYPTQHPTTCILRNDPMTPEEREQMSRLCGRIAVEKDPTIFNQLVRQLNDLLEKKYHGLSSEQQENPS